MPGGNGNGSIGRRTVPADIFAKRDFLTVDSLSVAELVKILDVADTLGGDFKRDDLDDHAIGMIFEKPSTRTRVSFEVAIAELGAHPVVLNAGELQLGRGETVEDTARTLASYLDAIVVRTFAQSRLETLASAGSIPVINALSDYEHPCQALADLQIIRELKGKLAGVRLAYLGDGNNVAHSLLKAGAMTGMHVVVGCPPGHEPLAEVVAVATAYAHRSGGSVTVTDDPLAAATDADVVYTDVWVSMGQEAERAVRLERLSPFQVNADLMAVARPDAIVLHCLPAHRGEEITAEVIDGPQSHVWGQASNRLYVQKALMLLLLGK